MMNARDISKAFIPFLVLFFAACAPVQTINETLPAENTALAATAIPAPTRTPFPTEEIIQGTISIRHAWDEKDVPVLAGIIKTFQTYYPGVLFDVLSVPQDSLLDYFLTESGAGTGPTLLLGPAEWAPVLYENGLAADLTGEFAPEVLGDLNQPALQASFRDGKLISLPYSVSGVVLFRNAQIITLPPNNFEELVSLAQASTQGNVIGAYLERSFFFSGAHLSGLGGQWIDENGLPGFNNGIGVGWLKLLKDFELAGPVSYFSDDDLERFKLGQVGWIIDGTWSMGALKDAIGVENLAVDPWPAVGDGSMSGFVQSENVFLSAKAGPEERRAALKFIQFLVASEAQTRLADTGQIPAFQNVFLSDKAYQKLILETILALNSGTAYPVGPELELYNLNLDLALRAYFDGSRDAEQALQMAQDGILNQPDSPQASPAP